jgi:hypothetical protein
MGEQMVMPFLLREDLPEVLLVLEGTPVEEVEAYLVKGDVPVRCETMTFDELLARDRVAGCTCGLISCRCEELRKHTRTCRLARMLRSPADFYCKHQRVRCEECDVCDCGADQDRKGVG